MICDCPYGDDKDPQNHEARCAFVAQAEADMAVQGKKMTIQELKRRAIDMKNKGVSNIKIASLLDDEGHRGEQAGKITPSTIGRWVGPTYAGKGKKKVVAKAPLMAAATQRVTPGATAGLKRTIKSLLDLPLDADHICSLIRQVIK